jgi:hypothetical protein
MDKPDDRQAWNINDLDRCCLWIDHPGRNQEGRRLTAPQGQMPAAVVELIGDHDCRPPEQRVERICDLNLAPQTPGIMRSRRTAGGKRAATLYTVLESAKLNGLDPEAYLADVIDRMAKGHPINRLAELLPWNWHGQPAKLAA